VILLSRRLLCWLAQCRARCSRGKGLWANGVWCCSPMQARQFVLDCLKDSPLERPTIAQLQSHAWVVANAAVSARVKAVLNTACE
jgi:hypothetical protein